MGKFILALFSFGFAHISMAQPTAIIVLGNPATKGGQPTRVIKARINKAVQLYQQGKGELIICSGAAVYNKFVEASVMAEYALSKGVPKQDLIQEPTARNTYENAARTASLLQKLGIHKAIIVTSSPHVLRAQHVFSHYLTDYTIVSCERDSSWARLMLLHLWEAHLRFKLWLWADDRLPKK